jgi:regulatory protein
MDDKFIKVIRVRKLKKKTRCLIELDSGVSFFLSLDLVLEFRISKDVVLSQIEIDALTSKQQIVDAKQSAYNYVAYKPRTEKQVRTRLREKGFDSRMVDLAVSFLYEFNYLDDETYAKNFVKAYMKSKPAGKHKLKFELLNKGIKKPLAEKTIQELYPDDDLPLVIQAAEKKIKKMKLQNYEKNKKSLIAFLQGKGFTWSSIKQAIEITFPQM